MRRARLRSKSEVQLTLARCQACDCRGLKRRQLDLSWAEPVCSIERDPLRQDHAICTAVAPKAVFTARTKPISAAFDPNLVFYSRQN